MKLLFYKIAYLFIVILLFACQKDLSIPTTANINYPAAFVVNGEDNSISVINLEKNEVATIINLNQFSQIKNKIWPHHISLSPDASTLAIATPTQDLALGHHGTGAETLSMGGVLLLNSNTGGFQNFISTERMNQNALFSPNGAEIWTGLLTHSNAAVLVFDNTLQIKNKITDIEVDPKEITFSANGKYAFVTTSEGRFLQVFDTKTKENVNNIKVDLAPEAAWAGSDGKMYVTSGPSKAINVIDVETLSVEASIDLGFSPAYAIYNSLADELWISHKDGNEVVIYSKKSGNWQKKQSIKVGNDAHAIVFRRDNKTAYVSNQADASISAIDVFSKNIIKTIKVGNKPNGIVIKE